MPVNLLASQLAALSVPSKAVRMDGTLPLDQLVARIRHAVPAHDPA